MKCVQTAAAMTMLLMAAGLVAQAGEVDDLLQPLEAKITKSLKQDRWHDASKDFLQALWGDYKTAYRENRHDPPGESLYSVVPDISDYDDYLGRYVRKGDERERIVEVAKTSEGRFVVKLEGYTIPSIAEKGTIVFTTGDVVYSRLPQLGEKRFADLEMFRVVRFEGTYFFLSLMERPREEAQLMKLEK